MRTFETYNANLFTYEIDFTVISITKRLLNIYRTRYTTNDALRYARPGVLGGFFFLRTFILVVVHLLTVVYTTCAT